MSTNTNESRKKAYWRPVVSTVVLNGSTVLLACTPPQTDCNATYPGCGCWPEGYDCDTGC